jgi:hypothetical protein
VVRHGQRRTDLIDQGSSISSFAEWRINQSPELTKASVKGEQIEIRKNTKQRKNNVHLQNRFGHPMLNDSYQLHPQGIKKIGNGWLD